MLSVQQLSYAYAKREVLRSLDFELARGELLGIVGANGSGKSTLLKVLASVLSLQTGSIRLQTKNLHEYSRVERACTLAYAEQTADMAWNMRVDDIVALGRIPRQLAGHDDKTLGVQALTKALQQCDLLALRERHWNELSGGERMRVMFARLLCSEAPLLLCDESMAAQDWCYQQQLAQLLRQHCQAGGSAIWVAHDLALLARYSDRLLLLQDGKAAFSGSAKELFTSSLWRGSATHQQHWQWRENGLYMSISAEPN